MNKRWACQLTTSSQHIRVSWQTKYIKVCLFLEFGSISGVHSYRPSTATKFPSFRFILAIVGNVFAGWLYRPTILKMALSIQLHDAHLWPQLQKRPVPKLRYSAKSSIFHSISMAPIQNLTILSNSTSHAGSNLLCTPASSSSIALFFFANYIAHCATVKQFPREKIPELFVAMVLALFLPCSGISRALELSSVARRSSEKMSYNALQELVPFA